MSYKVIHGKLVRSSSGRQFSREVEQQKLRANQRAARRAAQETVEQATADKVAAAERKGEYLGACNRSACLAPGAAWYNRGSYAFYCGACARMLNDANRHDEFCKDAPLCRLVTAEEAATLHVAP